MVTDQVKKDILADQVFDNKVEVKLPDTIEECHSLIRNLLAVIEKMQAEIEELKAKLNENSQNSNRPPAGDGFNKPNPKPAFSKKKKRKGGQLGHLGKTLRRVEKHDPSTRPHARPWKYRKYKYSCQSAQRQIGSHFFLYYRFTF